MTPRLRPALLLLLAGAACASAGGGKGKAPAVVHQADEKIPPLAAFQPGDERTAYNTALGEEQRGWRAESAGDVGAAKEPLEAAARAYLGFLQRFPNTGWDVTFRYHAADLLRRAGRYDDAVATAQQAAADPRADPKSKAMAELQAANAMTAAGALAPLQVEPRPRGSAQGAPREPVPEPWQRFVQAADAYLQTVPPTRPEPQDRTLSSAQLALVAARVSYATGDMEGARRRLAVILDRWPNESQVFLGAAPLYVQTFVATGDDDGARQAIAQVRETASAQAQRAQGQDARQAYEKVATDLDRVAAGVRYERAKSLLEQGRAEEAAQAFEAVAQEGGDVAASLAAAAIAWDRAGNGDRAAELRRRLLEQHADAKVTPGAALQLAAYLSKKGDHAGAAQLYGRHAEQWPDDPNHCTALRNGAVELDLAKQVAEAAERYRAFGSEQRCAQASPDVAALALYRAGQLFVAAKNRSEARAAYEAAASVQGVQTAEAKKRVADARTQAKKLGTAAGRRAPSR
jgi:tetratricopeptide (TPR) repeat protein